MAKARVGKEVGRVNVRVIPNTNDFRRELERQLKRDMKGFQVRLKVDSVEVNNRKIREDLEAQVDNLDFSPQIDITPRLNESDANRWRDQVRNAIGDDWKDTLRHTVKIVPELDEERLSDFRRDVRDLLNDDDIDRVKIKTYLDEELIRDQANNWRRDLIKGWDDAYDSFEKTMDRAIKVRLDVDDPDGFRKSVRDILDDDSLTKVQVKADLDQLIDDETRDRWRKDMSDAFDDTWDEWRKTEKFVLEVAAQIDNPERFKEEVRRIINDKDNSQIDVQMNLHSLAASAQLRYVTRTRVVDVLVNVSKTSLSAALLELSALSGARLTFDWIDDLTELFKNLDKDLPSMLLTTTGITSLVGALVASVGGLVGIGGDLAAIGPALLVVPGLLINALGSATALIVALRDSKTELGALSDDMSELGDLISETFWTEARDPIIDMTETLLPGLRTAFQDVSEGIGGFVAEMAKAFEDELGDGAIEEIFAGIAESWEILGEGAEGFAGAIVGLSEVAADYMPELAQWFSDLAGDFSTWLDDVSTSGELDSWIKNAVTQMEYLWEATDAVYGILEGLYTAADEAGFEGLEGFRDLMGEWEKTVKSAKFQEALTDIFEGSADAMGAFGDAVVAIGDMIAVQSEALETFIGSAGQFLGGLTAGIAKALESPTVTAGLNKFSEGLTSGLEDILPSLQPIGDTFGNFLGLLGTLAEDTLPAAAEAFSLFMPTVDTLIDKVEESGILETLGDTLVVVAEELAPVVDDLVGALSEAFITALEGFADVAPKLGTALGGFVEALTPLLTALTPLLEGGGDAWGGLWDLGNLGLTAIFDPSWLFDDGALADLIAEFDGTWLEGVFDWAESFDEAFVGFVDGVITFAEDIAADVAEWWNGEVAEIGAIFTSIGDWFSGEVEELVALWDGIVVWFQDQIAQLQEVWAGVVTGFTTGDWSDFWDAVTQGASDGARNAGAAAGKALDEGYAKETKNFPKAGSDSAGALVGGFGSGIRKGMPGTEKTVSELRKSGVDAPFSGIEKSFSTKGSDAGKGLASGMNGKRGSVKAEAEAWRDKEMLAQFRDISNLMLNVGGSAGSGLSSGISGKSKGVGTAVKGIRDEQIVGRFSDAKSMLTGSGEKVVGGLTGGIWTKRENPGKQMGLIKKALGDAWAQSSAMLKPSGEGVVDGLSTGIWTKRENPGKQMAGINKALGTSITNPDTKLKGSGEGVVDGLATGIWNKRENPGKQMGGIDKALGSSIVSPGGKLKGSGESVVDGLATGIWNKRENPGKQLDAINKDIPTHIKDTSSVFWGSGRSLVQGFIDGIASLWATLQQWIQDLANAGQHARNVGTAPKSGTISTAVSSAAFSVASSAKSTGNNIYVTQSLLPGETPAEQRDNLVRELRYV